MSSATQWVNNSPETSVVARGGGRFAVSDSRARFAVSDCGVRFAVYGSGAQGEVDRCTLCVTLG